MVLVDTSVWIDYLAGRETPQVCKLDLLIEQNTHIFTTGVIVQELLSGIKHKRDKTKALAEFDELFTIMPTMDTHIQAAELFDTCQKRGYTIRSIIDCLIAALALEYDLALLQNNKDYERIAKVSGLKLA